MLLGSDPNDRKESFIRLTGAPSVEKSFVLAVRYKTLKTVFKKEYTNLDLSLSSLLEFYTYLPSSEYIVDLQIDQFEKSIIVEL